MIGGEEVNGNEERKRGRKKKFTIYDVLLVCKHQNDGTFEILR